MKHRLTRGFTAVRTDVEPSYPRIVPKYFAARMPQEIIASKQLGLRQLEPVYSVASRNYEGM